MLCQKFFGCGRAGGKLKEKFQNLANAFIIRNFYVTGAARTPACSRQQTLYDCYLFLLLLLKFLLLLLKFQLLLLLFLYDCYLFLLLLLKFQLLLLLCVLSLQNMS